MSNITVYGLEIPGEAQNLDGFCDWAASLSESGPRVSFWAGNIHVDMSPQDDETHAPLVGETNAVLGSLAKETAIGKYYMPPSWFTVPCAGLSTEPDGFLVRWKSLQQGRVRINPTRKTEMLGAPDMVLEVVSKTSETKDLVDLVEGYAQADVGEYWIADGRRQEIDFRILLLDQTGRYRQQAPDADGWITSPTWGRFFRLQRFRNPAGMEDYRLEVRP